MSRRNRADVLLVGQTPPPFHGQSVVTAMLFEHDWGELDVERIRLAFSSSIDEVGSASVTKVFHLFALVFRTWKILLFRRPRILYYLPASPRLVPVIRDIVYLGLVRWFFPKIVFHYHSGGLDEFVKARSWLRPLAALVYGRADVSIEVNEWLTPAGQYFGAERNVVVMNGVSAEPQRRTREQSARCQFLYVGMLCEEKGINDLIDMMALLKQRNVDCELKLVGDWVSEDYREATLARVRKNQLEDRIIWAGVLHGAAKWQAYADADCFVFPTWHPTETFGLVLVEAMAAGLPLITTRWRGIPDIVGDDGCAELCDTKNPGQLADSATRIMGDDELRQSMGQAALQRYETDFTEKKFIDSMAAVFRSQLDDAALVRPTTKKRADVLLVGQTPPPFHGQSVVTAMLFEHDWGELEVERIRMAFSSSIDEVGSASFSKVLHLSGLVLRTWKILLLRRPRILYYLPASPALVPVMRDFLYLGLVRWFFPKIVFHYHAGGLDEFVQQRRWLRPFASLVYGRADISIEVNEWPTPAGEYFNTRRNVVINNGIKAEPQTRTRPESACFQCLYVGMLCEEKGVSDLVDMMAVLKDKAVDCELKLVGDWVSDSYREQTLSRVTAAALDSRIIFTGVLHGDAKWQAYADADCFAFPTWHPTEASPLVLVEAMAAGLPIITTDWRGLPSIVGRDGCAELCETRNPGQVAESALKIMNDPGLRQDMRLAARNRYEAHFTEETFLSSMTTVFTDLLHNGAGH